MHTYFHYKFTIEDVDILDYAEDDTSKNLKDMILGEEFLVYPYRSSEKINMQSVYSALIDFYLRYLKKNKINYNRPWINYRILLDDENEIFTPNKSYFFMATLNEKRDNPEHIIKIKFKCKGNK